MIFMGKYLFTGSEITSVWLEVSETKGDDVVCMIKNSATLDGTLFTLHASQVPIDMPTLSEKDKEVISTWGVQNKIDFLSLSYTCHAEDVRQTIEALSLVPCPEMALTLYLQCAQFAGDCDLEPLAYEFFTQAFILYEEEIAFTAIHLIIGTLQRMSVFGVENRDTLTHKATGNSAKLLKKADQCRAVYACSHLFWVDDSPGIKDGERVLLCLKRSLRIASAAQQMANVTRGSSGPVTLFVEILNKYLYFFEKGNPHVTSSAIQGLVELIKTDMQSDVSTIDPATTAFFNSTLRYIQFQKQKGGMMGEKYDPVKI